VEESTPYPPLFIYGVPAIYPQPENSLRSSIGKIFLAENLTPTLADLVLGIDIKGVFGVSSKIQLLMAFLYLCKKYAIL